MIKLTDSFFEDEIREGFYVPAELKQCWGAEITVLNEIDRVCKKHGLLYFACWGTLLGALRHGGIIPWDDDFDIVMYRKDYTKFMQVWKDELPEGYDVINYKTHPDHVYFISNVVGKSRICFEKEHLEQFHNFPYIAGIDIYVLDNMSRDEEHEKYRMKVADYITTVADRIYDGSIKKCEIENNLSLIEKQCQVRIPRKLTGVELRIFLYEVAEKWFANVAESDSDKIIQVMPWGITGRPYYFDRSEFEESIEIPFETGTIPVNANYQSMIRKSYGDFMAIYKDVAGHDYPFFDKQRDNLQKVLDFAIPGFALSKEDIAQIRARQTSKFDNQYKAVALEASYEMNAMLGRLVENSGENETSDEEYLAHIQQLAIDLGTYIERVKGEGYITVGRLEDLCEMAYQYSVSKDDEIIRDMIEIGKAVESDIRSRREVIFMPFHGTHWNALESEYKRESAAPATDVYIVAIPCYYKNYDETLRDIQYDADIYPDNVNIIRYDEFDMELHYPDRIYIQYPYDQYNKATGILPQHYSKKLLDRTGELIYIPWFKTSDFDKTDARAYKNMRYYCCMPGVVYADRTYVQSDNMRKMYIAKLCDFAGEDTRDIWEDKIRVQAAEHIADCVENCKASKNKTLLYMVDFGSLMEHKHDAIVKIRKVLGILKKAHVEHGLGVIWHEQPTVKIYLSKKNPELYGQYVRILEDFVAEEWGEYDSIEWVMEGDSGYASMYGKHIEDLVDRCTAYYGDPGWVAHLFRSAGKPVMLQDYSL